MQSGETRAIDTGSGDTTSRERTSALARVEAAARKMRRTVEHIAWQWHGVNASMQMPLITAGTAPATAQRESPGACVRTPP
jgi:hypothetical protein